jgi:hypothetical protein
MAEGGGQKPERKVQKKLFPCDKCSRCYMSENTLFNHYIKTHIDDDLEEFGRTELTSASPAAASSTATTPADCRPSGRESLVHKLDEKSPTHKCLSCDLTFTSKTLARRHDREKHPELLSLIVPLPPPLSPLPRTPAPGVFSVETITQAAGRAKKNREAAEGKVPPSPPIIVLSDDELDHKPEQRGDEEPDVELELDQEEFIDITEEEAERARRAPLDEPELLEEPEALEEVEPEESAQGDMEPPANLAQELPVIVISDSPPPPPPPVEIPRVCAVASVTSGPRGARVAHRVLPEKLPRHYLMNLLNTTETIQEITLAEGRKYDWTEEERDNFKRLIGHMRYGIIGGINGCRKRLPPEDSAEAMRRYRKVLDTVKEEIPHPGEN